MKILRIDKFLLKPVSLREVSYALALYLKVAIIIAKIICFTILRAAINNQGLLIHFKGNHLLFLCCPSSRWNNS